MKSPYLNISNGKISMMAGIFVGRRERRTNFVEQNFKTQLDGDVDECCDLGRGFSFPSLPLLVFLAMVTIVLYQLGFEGVAF